MSMERPDRPRHEPFDWKREQVFAGYDPERDGFAYPVDDPSESPEPRADCSCTVVPPPIGLLPENRFDRSIAEICEPCLFRLLLA